MVFIFFIACITEKWSITLNKHVENIQIMFWRNWSSRGSPFVVTSIAGWVRQLKNGKLLEKKSIGKAWWNFVRKFCNSLGPSTIFYHEPRRNNQQKSSRTVNIDCCRRQALTATRKKRIFGAFTSRSQSVLCIPSEKWSKKIQFRVCVVFLIFRCRECMQNGGFSLTDSRKNDGNQVLLRTLTRLMDFQLILTQSR